MNAKKYANLLLNDFQGILNKHKVKINACGIEPEDFRVLTQLMYCQIIDKKQFRDIVERRILEYKAEKAFDLLE